MSKPVLAVLGATGAQGGSVARAALADAEKRFQVRALTRRTRAPEALALAQAGAEIVQANLDDIASLQRAFDGAHAVFGVTNFWEHHDPDVELEQAGRIASAAKACGVRHVVWSTLEDTRKFMPLNDPRMPTLRGRFKVPHFDAKGAANRLFRQIGVPTTFLYLSFYWDNLIHFGMGPQRMPSGELAFVLPIGDIRLPGIAAEDIGPCALSLFQQRDATIGQSVGIAGEHLTLTEMSASLGRALGEPVLPYAMPRAEYARLGFPGADDLANMFQFKQDFNEAFCRIRPVAGTRALHPGLMSFDMWLARHAHRIAVPPRFN